MRDLKREMETRYHQYDVLQLITVIAESFREKIRFEADPSLTFPSSDISEVRFDADNAATIRLSLMGLLGITASLPVEFSDYVGRDKKGAGALMDFLSITQNRIHALWAGAYRKYAIWRDAGEPAKRIFEMLTARSLDDFAKYDLFWFGAFSNRTRTSHGLKMMIRSVWRSVPVTITENIPRLTTISNRRRLGRRLTLGKSAIVGSRVYDRTAKFRVSLGPVDVGSYVRFLPGGDHYDTLKNIISLYVNEQLICEMEVSCDLSEFEPTRLGAGSEQLGRTTVLGRCRSGGGGVHRYRTVIVS